MVSWASQVSSEGATLLPLDYSYCTEFWSGKHVFGFKGLGPIIEIIRHSNSLVNKMAFLLIINGKLKVKKTGTAGV